MKEQLMIEDLNGVKAQVKEYFTGKCLHHDSVCLDASELNEISDAGILKVFYGILECGIDTTAIIANHKGGLFQVSQNTQIITSFKDIEVTGPNAFFRGWIITD